MADYPNAEQPTTVAQELYEMDVIGHVNAEANFNHGGVTYELTAWMDDDETAGDVAKVCKAIQRAGYRVDTVGETGNTDSIVIKAEDA